MSFFNALYTLTIKPLALLFDVIFAVVDRSLNNPGLTIIVLSFVVNLLVLPLYRRADAMQAEARDKEKQLSRWTDHIKRVFSGDERFMLLQTYYRQNDYKPTHALKGSLSLLLEIPFFIAAYRFLSGLQLLQGVSFGPIKDLSVPDAMFTVSGFTVNVLPIIMTLINILSAAVYMQGFPFKSKLQMYGMAFIFLVLLYGSPSGLVLYWTMNNVFSLVKNIFYKLKDPAGVLRIGLFLIGVSLQEYILLMRPFDSFRKTAAAALVCLLMQMPLVLRNVHLSKLRFADISAVKEDPALFWPGCLFMTILTGVLIPSAVIKSSPADFINIQYYYSPFWYILSSFLLAAGTFLLWFGVFYQLASSAGKKWMELCIWILAVCAGINYMFFGTERGNLSSMLVYDTAPTDSSSAYLKNLAVLLTASLILYLIWRASGKIVRTALFSLCCAAVIMSIINTADIQKNLVQIKSTLADVQKEIPKIRLSKNGKNVVILMMDRSVGFYIPFLMAEKPELREQFQGFTYYPNTITHGTNTNIAIPSLYGGYEYLPEKINRRSDEPLVEKHNEALRMMPILFDESGYDVTILSPSYANYQEPSDLHIYDDHPDITARNVTGLFTSPELQEAEIVTLQRNFFCFGIYKTAPLIFQPTLYSAGLYNDADAVAGRKGSVQTSYGILSASGFDRKFIENYDVLLNLPNITEITETDSNTFMTLDNGTAHEPVLLQMPDYSVSGVVDNTPFDTDPAVRNAADGRGIRIFYQLQMEHYHANMAAYQAIGRWMDHLRENGVYDNTRIIIVADHGIYQIYPEHMFGKSYLQDVLWFNPVLMVKDFDEHEFKTDDRFMTNADVPLIAMAGLIEDPVNPSTGNPVTDADKFEPVHHILRTDTWNINDNHGNVFVDTVWYELQGDNIFDLDHWKITEDFTAE